MECFGLFSSQQKEMKKKCLFAEAEDKNLLILKLKREHNC